MKKSAFVAAGLLTGMVAFGQKLKESDVPATLKDAFNKSYPNAKEIKWEKEGANFEVEFELGKIDQSAIYDMAGQLIETEVEIKVDELPASVKDYVEKNYKDVKIKEAEKITDAKGMVSYEVEIKSKDLVFDNTGKFIKEEIDKDED